MNEEVERATSPIAGVLVHVGDVAQALRWYGQAFPKARTRDDLAVPGLGVLDIDGVLIELVLADDKVASGAAGSVVYWWVPGVTSAIERLREVGGHLYRGPMDIGGELWMCQVRGPVGKLHRLERAAMNRKIVGYHQDDEQHWVAELECGHNQHVRHDPPWINRPWVVTPEGRAKVLGQTLPCKKCDEGAPRDWGE